MSFDVGIWFSERALDAEAADALYQALCEGAAPPSDGSIAPSPKVAAFLSALAAHYPDLDSLSDAEVDDSPWSSGFEYSDRHAVFNIRWSQAEAMLAEMRALATAHGLVLYDPQESVVYNPPNLAPVPRWQFWRR